MGSLQKIPEHDRHKFTHPKLYIALYSFVDDLNLRFGFSYGRDFFSGSLGVNYETTTQNYSKITNKIAARTEMRIAQIECQFDYFFRKYEAPNQLVEEPTLALQQKLSVEQSPLDSEEEVATPTPHSRETTAASNL